MVSISLFFSRSFPSPLSHIYLSAQEQSPSLEDCLKLLKGERDEQRLAGLLLVTKFCKGDDLNSLHRVYDAVGLHFLDRLLRTGISYIYLLFLFQEEKNLKNCWKLVQITCLFKGMGKGSSSESDSGSKADNRDAYLQLSVTVLAAFCRVPEIASSKDMSLKIPLILEIMSNE